MKNKVLIIEDNDYKYFTTKAILQSQLKLDVQTGNVLSGQELLQATSGFSANQIIFRPQGGVADLLMKLKKRKINRRNTEIVLISASEISDDCMERFQQYLEEEAPAFASAA
jgi:CheY-like chemotaxis protein